MWKLFSAGIFCLLYGLAGFLQDFFIEYPGGSWPYKLADGLPFEGVSK